MLALVLTSCRVLTPLLGLSNGGRLVGVARVSGAGLRSDGVVGVRRASLTLETGERVDVTGDGSCGDIGPRKLLLTSVRKARDMPLTWHHNAH